MAYKRNVEIFEEAYKKKDAKSVVSYVARDGRKRYIAGSKNPDGSGDMPSGGGMTEVTWQELKDKRDVGKLTPGSLYRITDYQCTTTQENTQSAGHQFDIVLLALSENKLAEEGWAMQHANDTYFANSNLSAWKVWYCLDNDKSRFAWADEENGKGVVYRLVDEFNNDIKYDFKNIQFKRKLTNGQYDANGTETWCYTLNLWYEDKCQDASIVGNTLPNDESFIKGVYGNVFGYATAWDLYIEGIDTFAFALGNNVVLSIFEDFYYGIYSNTTGNSFHNNTIGDSFHNNTIGNLFYSNTISGFFELNTIGNEFNGNVIGSDFYGNTIGNSFVTNTIGDSFQANTIGAYFTSNIIGLYFRYNMIGGYLNGKTISDNTSYKNYGTHGVELATKDDLNG